MEEFGSFLTAILILSVIIYGCIHFAYLNNQNIDNYFGKPYCQEVSLGGKTVKKCFKLVEIEGTK